MSLAFADHVDGVAADHVVVELGPVAYKAQLLTTLARALNPQLDSSAVVDNLDAFYDHLTEASGAIAAVSAAAWWRAEPLLMSQVSQCFIDVGGGVALTWVMTSATETTETS